jgi:hypothetical protein
LDLLREYDGEVFNGFAISLPSEEALDAVRSEPEVEYVEADQECQAAWTQTNAPWNLARISQRKLTNANYVYNTKAGSSM